MVAKPPTWWRQEPRFSLHGLEHPEHSFWTNACICLLNSIFSRTIKHLTAPKLLISFVLPFIYNHGQGQIQDFFLPTSKYSNKITWGRVAIVMNKLVFKNTLVFIVYSYIKKSIQVFENSLTVTKKIYSKDYNETIQQSTQGRISQCIIQSMVA